MNYNWSSAYFDAHIDNVSSIRRSNQVTYEVVYEVVVPALVEKRRCAATIAFSAIATEYNGPLEAVGCSH